MGTTRKIWPKCPGIVVRARDFSQSDIVLIRKLIRNNPSWGRTRLSQEVCKALEWRQANERCKERACRVALVRLESLGYLSLPKRKAENGGRPPSIGRAFVGVREARLTRMPELVTAKQVGTKEEARQWNAAVASYHYLGLATPVGRTIRYLLFGDDDLLGAISFSDAAWKVSARDRLLDECGLRSDISRDSIVANNRFLIFPWVEVPNLASRFLALSVRSVANDWRIKYGVTPLLAETFVDPRYYFGTCYKAAGWIHVGSTRGYAKRGSSHEFRKEPKLLFLRGLTTHIQLSLQSGAVRQAA